MENPMPLSLYEATIPTFQQILGSVAKLLDKAEAFCAEQSLNHDVIIQAKLAEDMLPFTYQVKSCAEHSLGAIEGVRKGVFSPSMEAPPGDFASLHTRIANARAALDGLSRDEVESFIGQDMQFAMGSYKVDFTAENFLLSFSLPNFYFHATTAYDILRHKGVKIGKTDFLGAMRKKG
jgi:uncharacterized protein